MVVEEDQIREMTESVWSTVLGLPVAPRERGDHLEAERFVTGCVQISGHWRGALTLACSSAFARRAAAAMFGSEEPDVSTEETRDGLGELTNMVGGNVKGLLPGPSRLSLPTVVEGGDYSVAVPGTVVLQEVWLDCEGEPVIVKLLESLEAAPETER
jgi:chemotaxis protein CheX